MSDYFYIIKREKCDNCERGQCSPMCIGYNDRQVDADEWLLERLKALRWDGLGNVGTDNAPMLGPVDMQYSNPRFNS